MLHSAVKVTFRLGIWERAVCLHCSRSVPTVPKAFSFGSGQSWNLWTTVPALIWSCYSFIGFHLLSKESFTAAAPPPVNYQTPQGFVDWNKKSWRRSCVWSFLWEPYWAPSNFSEGGGTRLYMNLGRLGKTYACVLSCVQLFVTPKTAACQASLSMEFSRQEYWSGLPFPLPDLEIEPAFPVSPTSPKGPVYPKNRILPVFIHPEFPSGAPSVGNCSGWWLDSIRNGMAGSNFFLYSLVVRDWIYTWTIARPNIKTEFWPTVLNHQSKRPTYYLQVRLIWRQTSNS